MDNFFSMFEDFQVAVEESDLLSLDKLHSVSAPSTSKTAISNSNTTQQLSTYLIAFLDSWLVVLEKLTDPERVQNTPHSIPAKKNDAILANSTYIGFEPMEYLIRVHRMATASMTNIMPIIRKHLMKQKQILNLILTVYGHLYKTIITIEKYTFKRSLEVKKNEVKEAAVASNAAADATSRSSTSSSELHSLAAPFTISAPPSSSHADATAMITTSADSSSIIGSSTSSAAVAAPTSTSVSSSSIASTASSNVPQVSLSISSLAAISASSSEGTQQNDANAVYEQMLDLLVDMGFSRTSAADALIQTGYDVPAAAEWLLTHPEMSTMQVS